MDYDEEDVLFPSPTEQIVLSPLTEMCIQQLRGSVLIDEYLFGGCSPWSFTSFLDKFPIRVPSTKDLFRVELPSRVSSTMDLLSDQQQIPGGNSACSPTETLPIPSGGLYLLVLDHPR